MLSSMMSVASAMSTTAAVSMLTTVGVSELSVMAVVSLIALLCLLEVLSASRRWNGRAARAFNMAIVPLFAAFMAIAVFRVLDLV
jgi:hypothetical protein